MANYYFLGTLLPELHIDEPPEMSFAEFDQLLQENLTTADYAKTQTLRNFYDIYNLRSYWKGELLDPAGTMDENALQEAIVTRATLPRYVFGFIDKYETKEEKLRHFPELLANFFNEEIKRASGFFKAFLSLERELRLVTVAFRAKKLGRDLFAEFQYENSEDPFVAQILAQRDASQYEPPEKYEELKPLFDKYYNDPLALKKALIEFRFNKIDAMLGIDMFSIDRILGYMVKLLLIERWHYLDQQKGLEIIDSMWKEAP